MSHRLSFRALIPRALVIFVATVLIAAHAVGADLITTIAGDGASGDGSLASGAGLSIPTALAVDAAGSIYINDQGDGRIRKIDGNGIITTIAGGGALTGDGISATAALLANLNAVAVDGAGTVYLADGDRIRKIDGAGIITTYAGGGVVLGDGGPALAAQFIQPAGLAVDLAGALYVTDPGDHRIRRIGANGIITTVAGTGAQGYSGDLGPAAAAAVAEPAGITVDGQGNVFFADRVTTTVRKIDVGGIITTVAGQNARYRIPGDGGPATDADLATPVGVAVDAMGQIFIAENGGARIRQVDASGTITTIAGIGLSGFSGDGGPAADAEIQAPQGLAIDSMGRLLIADTGNARIRQVGGLPAAPVITSALHATAQVGATFTYQITAAHAPLQFDATVLPAWLSVDATSGALTGQPISPGSATYAISATNAGGTGTADLVLTVIPRFAPVITSSPTATAQVGTAFTYQIDAINAPTSYGATGLPAGLAISATNGAITGAPLLPGSATVSLTATNDGGTGAADLIITVDEKPKPVITSAVNANAQVGSSFFYQITAINSVSTYGATGLPSGLNLNATTGAISGTPTVSGSATVALAATNAGGTGTANLILLVDPRPVPVITSNPLAHARVGTAFSYQTVATNPPNAFSATGLPGGLTINPSTGQINGTPTSSGNATAAITAINAGGSAILDLVLTVDPMPVPLVISDLTATAQVGTPFLYSIIAQRNPVTYDATNFPAGLSITALTNVIAGTPTTAGTTTVTISATNAGGAGTASLILNVLPPPAPVITSALAVTAQVGSSFTYHLTASHAPTSFNATNLPAGLTYDPTVDSITGTPTASGTADVDLTATNATGSGQATLHLTVSPALVPFITSATAADAQTGQAFSYQIIATNSPASYAATGLPAGLSVSATTGEITGTPTATGSATVTLSATNGDGTGTAQLVVAVNPVPVVISSLTATAYVGLPYTFQLFATNSPATWTATGLPPDLHLTAASGLISGQPTATGTSVVSLTASNDGGTGSATMVLVVDPMPVPVINSLSLAHAQVGKPFSYQLTALNTPSSYDAANLPAGLSIDASGGVISGTPTTAGTVIADLSATNAGGTGTLALTVIVDPVSVPVITSALTATAQVGKPFGYAITAANSPTSFAAVNLPAGLTLSATSGIITGTPTTSGTVAATITASNAGGPGSGVLTVTVNPPAIPVITSALIATGQAGTPFTYQVTATNSPTSYADDNLPTGLSIDATTGAITGTPTTAGTVTGIVEADNDGGRGPAMLTIRINAQPVPVITSAPAASAEVGTPFSYLITATNSPSIFVASNLPAGLTVSPTMGTITGTPTASGTTVATIAAANAGGSGTSAFAVTVAPLPLPVITSLPAATGRVGVAFVYSITASHGPTAFDATGLPAGLAIDTTTGAITGTPAATGTTAVTVSATNDAGTVSVPLTLTVIQSPAITSAAVATAQVGVPFAYQIAATNSPTSYAAIGYPSGITVSTTSGALAGSPSVSGTFTVAIAASNDAGTGSGTLTLTVLPATPVVTAGAAVGQVGVPFAYQIDATSNPNAYAATGLPAGIAVDASNGLISGIPAAVGTTSATISATNAGGTGSAALTLTWYEATVITSATAATTTINQNFSYQIIATGSPGTYTATGLPAGVTVNPATGAIGGFPSALGTTTATITASNGGGTGTATLTITVVPPPPVITSAATATAQVGANFFYHITATNSPTAYAAADLPPGLSLSATGGNISGRPTTSGTAAVTLGATNAGGTGTKILTIAVNPASPVISGPFTTGGKPGTPFTFQINASNDPTGYGATGLPGWLAADASTGVLSGTPPATGTFTVTITATNDGGTASHTLTITITNPPVISSPATAAATASGTFTYQITATNDPTSYSATGLPTGVAIDSTTGIISGTTPAAGSYTITVSATNAAGSGSATVILSIPAASTATAGTATAGTATSGAVTASNGNGSGCGLGSGLAGMIMMVALLRRRRRQP